MRNTILVLSTIFLMATLYGCNEEPVGQTPTDSTPPGKITNPDVVNLPGGARITYTLPDDDDLLYVKAVYYINGVEKTSTATLYANSVEVMGFGSTDEQTVLLYCVDRSENHSDPVPVKIYPETPPVLLIRESMTMEAGFGGVSVFWKNEHKATVVIYLMAADENGDMSVADVVYTSAADGKVNLRNFDDTERLFGVYVRDRWDNYSDTLKGVFTPYKEMELDKSLFRRQILLGDNTTIYSSPQYNFENMWDGIVGRSQNIYHQRDESNPNYFTIDLGVTAQLNRYTLWHRVGYEYGNWNPKRWKVYGTAALSPSTEPAYWIDGGFKNDWFLLADCYSFKPSGDGPDVTQEDSEYAAPGFGFDIPFDIPPVRFIRFQMEESWIGVMGFHIAEVTFWGTVIE